MRLFSFPQGRRPNGGVELLSIELLEEHARRLAALLSAHQSIGLPQPLKLFGTPEQKQRYLPRLARGAISARTPRWVPWGAGGAKVG